MQLILQTANVTADAKNCSYPNKVTVTNASELQEAVKMDHVCAKYKNNYRNRENVQWLVEQSGVPFDFDMVVIDELSSFKNWQAKRFKSFMKVRPMVKRVVGLTGTPSSNGLMDLFAEFKVLDMGERLGRFIGQYRVNYFKPDRMNGPIVYTYKLLPGAEDRIYDKISDITISMKGTDYLEMPELISTEYKVYLDDTEKAKYP